MHAHFSQAQLAAELTMRTIVMDLCTLCQSFVLVGGRNSARGRGVLCMVRCSGPTTEHLSNASGSYCSFMAAVWLKHSLTLLGIAKTRCGASTSILQTWASGLILESHAAQGHADLQYCHAWHNFRSTFDCSQYSAEHKLHAAGACAAIIVRARCMF